MPNKLNERSSKSSSLPSNKNTTSTSTKSRKSTQRKKDVPRRTVPPLKDPSKTSKESKNVSSVKSGLKKSEIVKPKKTTKSEVCCSRNVIINRSCFDYCKKCGDTLPYIKEVTTEETTDLIIKEERKKYLKTPSHIAENRSHESMKIKENYSQDTICKAHQTSKKTNPKKTILKRTDIGLNPEKVVINSREPTRPVEQYYKNENFQEISDSAYEIDNEIKKMLLLETIKETSEVPTMIDDESSSLESTMLRLIDHTDTELDNDEYNTIQKLKAFRDENYFECHNAQSRIKSRGSATSLENHQCTYRFYLNERLFPVPLNMDHNENIRCVECHLPLELSEKSLASKRPIVGMIQAKVKIGCEEESQDTLLMLPVKDSLIIKEKRKQRERDTYKPDIVYFGIIKLDAYGNSMFNKTLPDNSLALRYQKGYKKFESRRDDHSFQKMEYGDIVYV